jgi:hypothetical protein
MTLKFKSSIHAAFYFAKFRLKILFISQIGICVEKFKGWADGLKITQISGY